MTTCDKCSAEKIVVEQAVTGFPDHHVAGTRQEYCGYCDEPPIVELSVTGRGAMVLTPNALAQADAACGVSPGAMGWAAFSDQDHA